jgi:polyphosphate kinase 2
MTELKDTETRNWLEIELEDDMDEELEQAVDDARIPPELRALLEQHKKSTIDRHTYFNELLRLQSELVKLQDWVHHKGLKMVILFEGRDSAGKGGAIKRIIQRVNPRTCRAVALPAPSDREKTQWYFQRYVPHLPAAGEIVLFDRSWYNRVGVERVMGFASEAQVEDFFRDVPEFERMLVRSGIILVKYWFSITDEEQQLRFLMRIHDPIKQWKLSPMDLQSRRRCSSAPALPRRPGTSWKAMTRSGRVSTASRICFPCFLTRMCRTRRSSCRSGCPTRTTNAARCRRSFTCRSAIEAKEGWALRAGR